MTLSQLELIGWTDSRWQGEGNLKISASMDSPGGGLMGSRPPQQRRGEGDETHTQKRRICVQMVRKKREIKDSNFVPK